MCEVVDACMGWAARAGDVDLHTARFNAGKAAYMYDFIIKKYDMCGPSYGDINYILAECLRTAVYHDTSTTCLYCFHCTEPMTMIQVVKELLSLSL